MNTKERLNEIRERLNTLRLRFEIAKRDCDKQQVEQILAECRPLQIEARELQALLRFAQICPISWTHTATEEAIEAKIADPVLRRLAAEPDLRSRSALLLGPTKVGKSTTLALALRRALRDRDFAIRNVRWFYARTLAQASKQYPLGEGVCPEIEQATKAELLVVDDLGLERDPGELIDILHARYEAGRPTWTTSGFTLAELRAPEKYGEALVRRLSEGLERPGRVVSSFPKQTMKVAR